MAIKYFDLNGTTAGFGTLTGAWNTTGAAFWSDSSAGTATPANYTFTSADTAAFGFAGTTATAGTATIATGVNVTLNKITTANLAGLQTIAASGTGQITLALDGATVPVIDVGSAGGLTISAPITGTAGFTRNGAGGPGSIFSITSSTNASLTGTVTFDAVSGALNTRIGTIGAAGTPNGLSGISTFSFANTETNTAILTYGGLSAYTEDASFVSDGASGSAAGNNVQVYAANGAGVTFTPTVAGGISNFTGSFCTHTESSASLTTASVTFNEFPSAASSFRTLFSGASRVATLTFNVGGSTNASVLFVANGTTPTLVLQNSAGASAVTIAGSVDKSAAFTGTLRLTGAGTAGTLSGIISNSASTLTLEKQGAGKWILSGANTYTGATSISAGTLSAQSATAFGSTTAGAVTQTGGTIEVTNNTALNKGTQALTLISAAGANALSSPTGTNSIACAGVTLNSTIIVDVASGASLSLNNTAAMSGSTFGITKNNSGEFALNATANTFTGAITVAAGTLAAANLQNSGTASSLGTGAGTSAIALTGTLKYTGTGHSTNRSLTFTGSTPALDASGSGAVTFSACTQAAGARTITFTGTSTANNTFSAALSDGTGAVGVAKAGIGKWILSNATLNYTGTTSCADGTLNLGSTNRTLGGALSVSGGTVENSTNTISANTTMTGGTITAELTGAKTLTVSSGSDATLQPTNNANSYTGDTTINAGGVLRLITGANPTTAGAGKVLGDSAVSVSGDLKTSATGAQRGQMRYGGNLTFNAGAKLYVGGA